MKRIFPILVAAVLSTSLLSACAVSGEKSSARQLRLGVMIGSTNEAYAESHYPDAKLERFNNYVDSAAALLADKLDYAMMDYTSALNITRHNPTLKIASDFLTDEQMCLGIAKDNPELAEQVSEIVDRYIEDGTMDEIISHWIREDGSDYEEVDNPKLDNAPTLTVAIVSSREPTTFVMTGKIVGMDVELIDRIAYELGYQTEYMDLEFGGLIAAMGSGKADLCMGIYPTPEREQQLNFSAPYFTNPQVMISKKNN